MYLDNFTLGCIMVRLLKIKDEEKVFKVGRNLIYGIQEINSMNDCGFYIRNYKGLE